MKKTLGSSFYRLFLMLIFIFQQKFRYNCFFMSSDKLISNKNKMYSYYLYEKSQNDLTTSLQHYFKAETIKSDQKYKCQGCGKSVSFSKKFSIAKSPKILSLHLKRFIIKTTNGGSDLKLSKNNSFLKFPINLNIENFVEKSFESKALPESFAYKLKACIIHSGGSLKSGHYYAYIRVDQDQWYEFNDSRVLKVTLDTVLNSRAYVLFYEKLHNPNTEISVNTTTTSMKIINNKESELQTKNSKNAFIPKSRNYFKLESIFASCNFI